MSECRGEQAAALRRAPLSPSPAALASVEAALAALEQYEEARTRSRECAPATSPAQPIILVPASPDLPTPAVARAAPHVASDGSFRQGVRAGGPATAEPTTRSPPASSQPQEAIVPHTYSSVADASSPQPVEDDLLGGANPTERNSSANEPLGVCAAVVHTGAPSGYEPVSEPCVNAFLAGVPRDSADCVDPAHALGTQTASLDGMLKDVGCRDAKNKREPAPRLLIVACDANHVRLSLSCQTRESLGKPLAQSEEYLADAVSPTDLSVSGNGSMETVQPESCACGMSSKWTAALDACECGTNGNHSITTPTGGGLRVARSLPALMLAPLEGRASSDGIGWASVQLPERSKVMSPSSGLKRTTAGARADVESVPFAPTATNAADGESTLPELNEASTDATSAKEQAVSTASAMDKKPASVMDAAAVLDAEQIESKGIVKDCQVGSGSEEDMGWVESPPAPGHGAAEVPTLHLGGTATRIINNMSVGRVAHEANGVGEAPVDGAAPALRDPTTVVNGALARGHAIPASRDEGDAEVRSEAASMASCDSASPLAAKSSVGLIPMLAASRTCCTAPPLAASSSTTTLAVGSAVTPPATTLALPELAAQSAASLVLPHSIASVDQATSDPRSVSFCVGDRVQTAFGDMGTVRFVGKTQFRKGEWVGVELDEPRGKNDGSVMGVSYFQCKNNHGLFTLAANLVAAIRQPSASPDGGTNGPVGNDSVASELGDADVFAGNSGPFSLRRGSASSPAIQTLLPPTSIRTAEKQGVTGGMARAHYSDSPMLRRSSLMAEAYSPWPTHVIPDGWWAVWQPQNTAAATTGATAVSPPILPPGRLPVCVHVTSTPMERKIAADCRRAIALLTAKKVPFDIIDLATDRVGRGGIEIDRAALLHCFRSQRLPRIQIGAVEDGSVLTFDTDRLQELEDSGELNAMLFAHISQHLGQRA